MLKRQSTFKGAEMTDVYTQGFIDKCAEHGIDPEELAKWAQSVPPEALPKAVSIAKPAPTFLENLMAQRAGAGMPGSGAADVATQRIPRQALDKLMSPQNPLSAPKPTPLKPVDTQSRQMLKSLILRLVSRGKR
jgi:hypothetical protein